MEKEVGNRSPNVLQYSEERARTNKGGVICEVQRLLDSGKKEMHSFGMALTTIKGNEMHRTFSPALVPQTISWLHAAWGLRGIMDRCKLLLIHIINCKLLLIMDRCKSCVHNFKRDKTRARSPSIAPNRFNYPDCPYHGLVIIFA